MAEARRFRARRLALTPLVDVIFLLLLFFMLTSSFRDIGALTITTGGAGAAAPTQVVFLRVGQSELRLGLRPAELSEIASSVPDGATVLVDVADGVAAQRLVDVLATLGADLDVVVLQ